MYSFLVVVTLMIVDSKVDESELKTNAVETINKESEATTTKERTEEGESGFEEGGC